MLETETEHAFFFETRERQNHAARWGMWLFLASEVALFSALFCVYAYYRSLHPEAFAQGIAENHRLLGTLNTVVLVCSSFTVALAVHAAAHGGRRLPAFLITITLAFAAMFLVIKAYEYAEHYHHGAWPGRLADTTTASIGKTVFANVYFLMTGAHAAHVIIGMSLLTWLLVGLWRGRILRVSTAPELGALYWHLVDLVWLYLWPLFYLTGGS